MKIFLTSSPGGSACVNGIWEPASFDRNNGFLERFKKACMGVTSCLIISSDPRHTAMNDEMRDFYAKAFQQSHMNVTQVDMCDNRNAQLMIRRLHDYGVLILSGGHVPTENAFFQKLCLRDRIRDYQGVVVGISAGTMNSAEVVYAAPEEPGEAIDPHYQKYIQGLGLTGINVLPHFQKIWDIRLDGLHMVNDICVPDSKVRPIYALPDGSYFYKENGKTTLYGEAWMFQNGICTKLCENGAFLEVKDEF
ncbi:MAG: Type 1 glutamine amidotransferase-like domain-containing protein [Lachnospiraceae bacterium]|nr:Type 1 glutamine amidotransferase-like domain-containing protein [Lachnospiraceae bacterium]